MLSIEDVRTIKWIPKVIENGQGPALDIAETLMRLQTQCQFLLSKDAITSHYRAYTYMTRISLVPAKPPARKKYEKGRAKA